MKASDKNKNQRPKGGTPEEYNGSDSKGNDQNAEWRKAGNAPKEDVLGNAEPSERGKDEFLIDNGIHRELDEPSEGHAPKHSERAKREFEEDQELHEGMDS